MFYAYKIFEFPYFCGAKQFCIAHRFLNYNKSKYISVSFGYCDYWIQIYLGTKQHSNWLNRELLALFSIFFWLHNEINNKLYFCSYSNWDFYCLIWKLWRPLKYCLYSNLEIISVGNGYVFSTRKARYPVERILTWRILTILVKSSAIWSLANL